MINAKQFELLKLLEKFTINSLEELGTCIKSRIFYDPICPIKEVQNVYEYLLNNGYVEQYRLTEKGMAEIGPCKVENAFIFAAGNSDISAKGVYSLPKGLYKVNGEVLIERQIKQLMEAGIEDIYVVVGYKKDVYFYLEDKYPIKLVVNPYPKKNNIYSLYAIAELIGSSYICNCDNYYAENPFDLYERDSYHATVYKQNTSREIMVLTNNNRRIKALYTGNEGGQCLYGHAFFNREFSDNISKFVCNEINNFRVDSLFWEEYYEKHISDLDMYARCYDDKFLWEFDSIQEVQNIDNLFIENVSIQAIEKICGILNCNIEDVNEIEILSKGLSNVLFTFIVKDQKYIFRYPGGSTSNIITSRKKEVVAQNIAAECNVDNTYVYIDETGCKLSKWVDDIKDLSNIYYKDDLFMEELARKIRIFHDAGRSFKATKEFYYDPIKEADRLLGMACESMGDLFVRFSFLRESVIKLFNFCEQENIQKTICHNDINGDNCLLTDTSFDIIDYEFAGYNDPAFDFGRVIGDYDYDSNSIDRILSAYFGRSATVIERRHWIAYVAIHDWYYFCWCLYKESINEDTREWMLYFYHRLKAVIPYVLPLYEQE
jgi:CTP:phosphocholine cytidylyltransferase-like protein/thiamine kinase-like enzyme